MSNFDNYTPSSVECAFKSQLTLGGSKRRKISKSKLVYSASELDDGLDDLEALLARRLQRGKGK